MSVREEWRHAVLDEGHAWGKVENVIAINELFVSRQIQPVPTSICRALKLGLSF
jgi:hypothetical protein